VTQSGARIPGAVARRIRRLTSRGRPVPAAVIARIDDEAFARELGRRSSSVEHSLSKFVRRLADADLIGEIARRDGKRSGDDGLRIERLPVRWQEKVLRAPRDDALVSELLRRVRQADLGGSVDPRLLGDLVAKLRPTRRLEYDRHPIDLAVSSNASYKRVRAVQKEPFTVAWLERSLRPGDVLYDVGANVGSYSLIAAKLVGGHAMVYAFEPAAPNFSDLCRNIALNSCESSVIPMPFALWSRTGLVPFGYRSFDPGEAGHTMSEEQDLAVSMSEQQISAFRLDDLVSLFDLPVPSLVKLDVDGSELEVLEGAVEAISQPQCRELMVEVNGEPGEPRVDALTAVLAGCGFQPVERHDPGSSGAVYQLFAKP
jgi:FkbM family methyltransferase